MSGSSQPAAPDYTQIIAAQTKQADQANAIAQDQLEFAKNAYNEQAPYTKQAQDIALQNAKFNQTNAQSDRARYEDIYQPVEKKQADTVNNWDSDSNIKLVQGEAGAGIGQSFDAQDAAATRQLEGFGVNPSDARYGAINSAVKIQRAAAVAGGIQKAGQDRQLQAVQLRQGVINTGQGVNAAAGGESGASTGAGVAGSGAGNSTFSAFAPSLGNPGQWAGLSEGALRDVAGTTGMSFNNAATGAQIANNNSSGVGALLGTAAGIATKFIADGGTPGDSAGKPMPGAVPMAASTQPGKSGDTVPAMLEPDEFVIPKRAVLWYGQKHFQKLIQKADEDQAEAPAKPETKMVQPQAPTYFSAGAVQKMGGHAAVHARMGGAIQYRRAA